MIHVSFSPPALLTRHALACLLWLLASPSVVLADPPEALLQAARQGDVVAQSNLGSLYLHGVSVKRNLHKALHWFSQAAAQGDGLAQFNLGLLYQEGQGIERDEQKAIAWLEKVANQSPRADRFNPVIKSWAQLKLGFIHLEGRTQPKNPVEARRWFEQAAAANIPLAMEMLGQIYAHGLGVERKPATAQLWYQRAAKLGSQNAAKALQALHQQTASPAEASSVLPPASPSRATPPHSRRPHRALTIQATPDDAQIRILNIRAPYRPAMHLAPGPYRIAVSKPGFQTAVREIMLGQKDRHLAIRLQPLQASVQPHLTIVPTLQGVMVRILNIDSDYQPGMPLTPGKYLLELSKPGFQTEQRWVELSDQDLKLEVTLTEAPP